MEGKRVAGAAAMTAFCRDQGLPYDVCGKVIVATSEDQIDSLKELHRRAIANGVRDVSVIDPAKLRDFEPHATGVAALHVPGTGITNYAEVAKKYSELASLGECEVVAGAEVVDIRVSNSEIVIYSSLGTIRAEYLINCAGLYSDRIAKLCGAEVRLKIVPFRGEYYELVPTRRHLVRTLIYPVPDPRFPFLGVHFTRRITGEIEAGPNAVLALKREGYSKTDFDLSDCLETIGYPAFWKMAGKYWKTGLHEMWRSASKASFVAGLQKLVPEIQSFDLHPAGSGVRAQALGSDGSLIDDFHFVKQQRALHVCNVPSPAATASLMIGRKIVEMAATQFGVSPRTGL